MVGLNNPIKRKWIRNLLRKSEEHLQESEEKYLGFFFSGLQFYAAAAVKKQGVCLGISKKLHWEGDIVFKDVDGHFLIVKDTMYGLKWTLVGVYTLQSKRGKFFYPV